VISIRHSVACERVRSQVSLELDGELSQLERAMMAAHLLRCGECRSFRTETTGFTRILRRAPFELLSRPVWVRRQRRLSIARFHGAVAAAMALAVVGVSTQIAQQAGERPSNAQVVSFPTQDELEREVALLEVAAGGGASSGTAGATAR
jgi:anti-sigma factor RsiW